MNADGRQPDIAKVRIGLAIIGAVVIVALVLGFVVESTVGKAVMFAVALVVFVRGYLLARALKKEQASPG